MNEEARRNQRRRNREAAEREAKLRRESVRLRFGVVTGTGPLMVDLGDSGDSLALVGNADLTLIAGDRVAVLVREHDALVICQVP